MQYNIEVSKRKSDEKIELELKIPLNLQKMLKLFSIRTTTPLGNSVEGNRYKIKQVVADQISTKIYPLFHTDLVDTRRCVIVFKTYTAMVDFIQTIKPEFQSLYSLFSTMQKEYKGKFKIGD